MEGDRIRRDPTWMCVTSPRMGVYTASNTVKGYQGSRSDGGVQPSAHQGT